MTLTVRDGLGGRVAAIANALSAGRKVVFGWAINADCPLPHRVVFPQGIRGVTFAEPEGDCGFTDWNERPFFTWEAAADRPAANAAYARIMAAMVGSARPAPGGPRLGLCARFWRNPHADPGGLSAHARRTARRLNLDRVFIMADRHRAALAAGLFGIACDLPRCPELSADLARTEADTLAFISDWKTLLACPWIVAPAGVTTMLYPARASGCNIIFQDPF